MNKRASQRCETVKYQSSLPPPNLSAVNNYLSINLASSLPEAFISSLRQLFAVLDQTNCGYVPFDIFKRYFDCTPYTADFLKQLEMESNTKSRLITFDALLHVIERSLLSSKNSSSTSMLKAERPLNRSTSALTVPQTEKRVVHPLPIICQSFNGLFELDDSHVSNLTNRKGKLKRHSELNLSTIRSVKQFQIERDLLIETCDTLDRVKLYLTDCLYEMRDKRKSYCRYLATAETIGIEPDPMYNRDLVADLFKLANIVIEEVHYDLKRSSDRSISSYSSSSHNMTNSQNNKQLKDKDDYIKRLETENRVLMKELMEMKLHPRRATSMKVF